MLKNKKRCLYIYKHLFKNFFINYFLFLAIVKKFLTMLKKLNNYYFSQPIASTGQADIESSTFDLS